MNVRVGVNPLLWSNDDLPMLGDETSLLTCLDEAHRAGFAGIEMGHKLPTSFDELGPLLAGQNLALVSGWYSSSLLKRGVDAEIEAMQPHLALMKAAGVKSMVFCETSGAVHTDRAIPVSRRPRLGDEDWQALVPRLQAVADYLEDEGVRMAYHHHMGTVVQSTDDVARLMDATDDRVGLLLDTGHCRFAGGDPVSWLDRWGERVVHVHCKDVRKLVLERSRARDASFLDSVLDGVFTIPGDGDVNFASVFGRLAALDYSGWLVVEAEQDPAVAPPWPLAQRSHRYVSETASAAQLVIA